jgi:MFS family permease
LWWANAVSSVGDGAFAAALPLLAVTITRDPRLVSLAAVATYLPWLLLSLPAGVLVDRYDRATLMWRSQIVQCAVVAVIAIGQATLVLLATRTLHVGARGYGVLLAAMAVGSVTGGLVNPALTRWIGEVRSLIVASGANAVIYIGIGLAPDAVIAGALLAANGFAVTMWHVVTVTMRQQFVPDDLLGRVNSAYRMLGWGLIPLGALAGGFVAQAAGLRAPFTVAGVLRGIALLAILPALLAAARRTGGPAE